MKSKRINKHLLDVLILCLLILVFHLTYLYVSEHQTSKYTNIDSYAYLNVYETGEYFDNTALSFSLKNNGLLMTRIFIGYMIIVSILIFYIICRKFSSHNISLLCTSMFSLSPMMLEHLNFTILDKNPFVIFFTLLLLGCIFYRLYFYGFISSIFLFWSWQGSIYIFIVLLIVMSLYFLYKEYYCYTLITYFTIFSGMMLYYDKLVFITSNFSPEKELINQTRNIFHIAPKFELLLLILMFIIIFVYFVDDEIFNYHFKNISFNNFLLFGCFIISFLGFAYMYRLNFLFVIFLYIMLSLFLEHYRDLVIPFIIGFIIIMGLSYGSYYPRELYSNNLIEAVNYADSTAELYGYDCIVSNWGYGHIYQYLSNKTVLYRGHPTDIGGMFDYLVYGNKTDCVLIYTDEDIKYLMYVSDVMDYNITDIQILTTPNKSFKSKTNYYVGAR